MSLPPLAVAWVAWAAAPPLAVAWVAWAAAPPLAAAWVAAPPRKSNCNAWLVHEPREPGAPSALARESRSIFATSFLDVGDGFKITVAGRVQLRVLPVHKGTLNVSTGDAKHAEYFKGLRPGSEIFSFKVPKWFDDLIQESAIPQRRYRTNPKNQGGLAPKIVDPHQPGLSLELPPIWSEWLNEVVIPGSGKVR